MRLMDEFERHFEARSRELPGALTNIGSFADLMWGLASAARFFEQMDTDPAFLVTGYTRYLAFARINAEIRYYAGPLVDSKMSFWYQESPDDARLAAVREELDVAEIGIVKSVEAAGALAEQYLAGSPLHAIAVERALRSRRG